MNQTNKRFSASGFTVVELLVTLVIIGIVLAMMLPAFSAVKKSAMNVRQKGQFSQIETGLEGYRTDFGDYPNDYYYDTITGMPHDYSDTYSGAQILAEAMLGQDGFGVHYKSQYRLDGGRDIDGDGVSDQQLYGGIPVDKAQRRGPYIDLEAANAVRVDNLYDIASIGAGDEDTFVLSDMYGKVKNKVTGKASGMPVLYYKANTSNTRHDIPTGEPYGGPFAIDRGYDYDVFTLYVNQKVFDWGIPFDSNMSDHILESNASWGVFYAATSNPNFTAPVRPYRSESFILHSAGFDGIYGTNDDVFNFEGNN